MNRIELVKSYLDLNSPDRHSHFSDDFQWTNASGNPPMDKSAYLGMGQVMESAFPDLSYVIEDIREEDDGIDVTGYFAGTFSNDFDLSALAVGILPATGAEIDFPIGTIQVTLDGDKICRIHDPSTGSDAGMAAFLKTLGVDMG
jgi:predicted ester cyclase